MGWEAEGISIVWCDVLQSIVFWMWLWHSMCLVEGM